MLDNHFDVLWGRATSGSVSFLCFVLEFLPLFCFSFYNLHAGIVVVFFSLVYGLVSAMIICSGLEDVKTIIFLVM
jgi:hypothetical protein